MSFASGDRGKDVDAGAGLHGSLEVRALAPDEDVDVLAEPALLVEDPAGERGMGCLEGAECLADIGARDLDLARAPRARRGARAAGPWPWPASYCAALPIPFRM